MQHAFWYVSPGTDIRGTLMQLDLLAGTVVRIGKATGQGMNVAAVLRRGATTWYPANIDPRHGTGNHYTVTPALAVATQTSTPTATATTPTQTTTQGAGF